MKENEGKGWLADNVGWFITHPIGTLKACGMWLLMPVRAPWYVPVNGIVLGISVVLCWHVSALVPFIGIWHMLALTSIAVLSWFLGLMITLACDRRDLPHFYSMLTKSAFTGPLWCSLVPLLAQVLELF